MLPACQGYGIGIIPWSPLHGGLLSGVLRRHGTPGAGGSGGPGAGGHDTGPSGGRSSGGRAAEAIQEIRPQIEAYEAFCAELGEDPAVVALAWLLHQPAVTAPIVGPRTLDQLTGALRALEVTLDEKTLGRLDEIFPGPGGAAPEAYAW